MQINELIIVRVEPEKSYPSGVNISLEELKMNPENSLIKKQAGFVFPAKIFSYLALCENLKHKAIAITNTENKVKCPNLPLFSGITRKFTPQGVVHAHLSFLKYSH